MAHNKIGLGRVDYFWVAKNDHRNRRVGKIALTQAEAAAAILRLARHYEEGAKKYGDRNWEKGIPINSFIDSGFRHLLKYMDGQTDEDHLCAAVWNLLGAMWTEEKHHG